MYKPLLWMRATLLNRSSTFQILFNFFGVFSVIAFCFFVEFFIPLVDVIDICFVKVLAAPVIFFSLLDPKMKWSVIV